MLAKEWLCRGGWPVSWLSMPRKLATQRGAGFKSRGPHLASGEKEICKAPLPVAPLQIAQSPAAKMPDRKGSTASALESSKSLNFPANHTPKFAIYYFCASVW